MGRSTPPPEITTPIIPDSWGTSPARTAARAQAPLGSATTFGCRNANGAAVAFVKGFFQAGRPVAAICHAPWTLIEADVVRGRTLTSWPSLRTDLRNAGATWVDEQVKICTAAPSTLITSRKPDDLSAFPHAFRKEFGA